MNTLQFQQRWPELHSDKVRRAIRCLPADVAIAMPDEWLDETVRRIAAGMDEVAELEAQLANLWHAAAVVAHQVEDTGEFTEAAMKELKKVLACHRLV